MDSDLKWILGSFFLGVWICLSVWISYEKSKQEELDRKQLKQCTELYTTIKDQLKAIDIILIKNCESMDKLSEEISYMRLNNGKR